MEDALGAVHRLAQGIGIEDAALHKADPLWGAIDQVADIPSITVGEIVDDGDAGTEGDERVA